MFPKAEFHKALKRSNLDIGEHSIFLLLNQNI